MQRNAAGLTDSDFALPRAHSSPHRPQFIAARDSRNRRVPGLWIRNGRYYGQLWVDLGNGRSAPRRLPLCDEANQPARTLSAAKEALEIKRNERREQTLPTFGRKPRFADYAETYFQKATVQRKREGTIDNERQAIARWNDHLGRVRLDRITAALISGYVEKRLKGGVFCGRFLNPAAERTVNLDLVALRNVFNAAVDDGHLRAVPSIKALDEPPAPKRRLITPEEFDRLVAAAMQPSLKNGAQLADYLLFLAFTGAREQEALRIAWSDVDFGAQRVVIGSDGLTKNWETRCVEFSEALGAHLQDMYKRRAADSSWLFPSPQRGKRDVHARSFRESLKRARKTAGLEWIGFHDLRHYFASMCVMVGIDFMTIAAWLGHKDGGILVGKVYGHLLDRHRYEAASRVRFR